MKRVILTQVQAANVIVYLTILLSMASCNFRNSEYKNPVKVSKSIMESKNNGVFIMELQISDILNSIDSIEFPIHEAWVEKHWHLELNEKGDEKIVIDGSNPKNIVFGLKKDLKLSYHNILDKWVIWQGDKSKPCSSISGMPVISLTDTSIMNTSHFTIYLQSTPNDFKRDIEKIFTFNLTIYEQP